MKRTLCILTGLLIVCLYAVSLLNRSTVTFLVKKPLLPPRYRKNNYTVQNIIDDSVYYHLYYKFRNLNGENIGWKWKYNKEDLDNAIASFGIPAGILRDYRGSKSQLEEIYAGLFHIREYKGSTTVFGVNHNAVVNAYLKYARPLAALLEKTSSEQDPANRWKNRIAQLLFFTQDIPYGVPADIYGDRYYFGFLPPPLCLVKAWGDCDTKSVLFCTILSHFPEYKLITMDFPGHAAVGVQGIPGPYDTAVEYMGEQYILCEPVGPRHTPFGNSMYAVSTINNIFPITVSEDNVSALQNNVDVEGNFEEGIISSSSYEEKIEAAVIYIDSRQYDTAVKLLFEIGLEFPDEYLPLYYLGGIYREMKDELFKEYYKKAIEICIRQKNIDFTMYVHCADMYYYMAEYMYSAKYYYLAYTMKNDSYYVLYRLGKCFYLENNFAKAIYYFNLASEQNPESVVIYYYLGMAYIHNNKKDDALPYLEKALELDPHDMDVAALLLQYYMSKLVIDKCQEYIDHILTLDKQNPAALFSRAQLYFFHEEYDKALEVMHSIKSEPKENIDKIPFYYWQGLIFSQENNETAEISYRNVIEMAKPLIDNNKANLNDYIYYGLAAAEIEEERDEAIITIQNRIKADRYFRYYYSLANARLIEQKNTPNASLNYYIDAISHYKNAGEMMYQYLCYYFIEKIYNIQKLEILKQKTE